MTVTTSLMLLLFHASLDQILGHLLLDIEARRVCPELLSPPADAAYQSGLALLAAHVTDARVQAEDDVQGLSRLKEELELAARVLGACR